MANIRPKDLATTATISAADDYLLLDGATEGTRKIAAASVAELASIAALLADTALVAPEDGLVLAGGYRFQVAASGASDHHITTSGGVKLYALPNSTGFWLAQFGIFPDTGSNITVSDFQAVIDYCATELEVLNITPGVYLFNQDKGSGAAYDVIDMPSNMRLRAYGVDFEDLLWETDGTTDIEVFGGRYYNRDYDTSWLWDINIKRGVFKDLHFDQEAPATTTSPWIYIREGADADNRAEDLWFERCRFTNRSNIQIWNAARITFSHCQVLQNNHEDYIVLKTRAGRGVCENVLIDSCIITKSAGFLDIGTQVGEDMRNLTVSNCTSYDSTGLVFLEAKSTVNADEDLNRGNVYDVSVSNCVAYTSESRLNRVINIIADSGSKIERVHITNMTIICSARETFKAPFAQIVANRGVMVADPAAPSEINDVLISNITAKFDEDDVSGFDMATFVRIDTDDGATLSNIVFDGITLRGWTERGFLPHPGVSFRDCRLIDHSSSQSTRGAITLYNDIPSTTVQAPLDMQRCQIIGFTGTSPALRSTTDSSFVDFVYPDQVVLDIDAADMPDGTYVSVHKFDRPFLLVRVDARAWDAVALGDGTDNVEFTVRNSNGDLELGDGFTSDGTSVAAFGEFQMWSVYSSPEGAKMTRNFFQPGERLNIRKTINGSGSAVGRIRLTLHGIELAQTAAMFSR